MLCDSGDASNITVSYCTAFFLDHIYKTAGKSPMHAATRVTECIPYNHRITESAKDRPSACSVYFL